MEANFVKQLFPSLPRNIFFFSSLPPTVKTSYILHVSEFQNVILRQTQYVGLLWYWALCAVALSLN